MKWWPFRRHRNGLEEAQLLELAADAKLRAAKRMTRHVQQMAPVIASVPAEEFAQRVARAYRGLV